MVYMHCCHIKAAVEMPQSCEGERPIGNAHMHACTALHL